MAAQNLPKHTYTANSPDGSIIKRTTTRAYEYVVCALYHKGHYEGRQWIVEDETYWSEAGWAGSMELAQKLAKKYSQTQIVPVNNPRNS